MVSFEDMALKLVITVFLMSTRSFVSTRDQGQQPLSELKPTSYRASRGEVNKNMFKPPDSVINMATTPIYGSYGMKAVTKYKA